VNARVGLTIGLSLLAALLYAISNVLEQHEARQVPDEHFLRASLMLRLVRRPLWLVGFTADVGAYVTAAAALALGAVVFVQPILSMGLLISLAIGALVNHRKLVWGDVLAAVVLCGGLALFLYEVSPTGGSATVPLTRLIVWGPVIGLSIAGCLVAARIAHGSARAALLAIAAGVSFAAGAVCTKAFVHYLGDAPFAWVPHWEPYALAVLMIGGFIIQQSSFQVGYLAASVAGLEASDPIAAAVLGVALLDERLRAGTALQSVAIGVAALAVVYGIVGLARTEAELIEASQLDPHSGEPLVPSALTFDPEG
jgi:drug/metabolite transporter (DMT)-like permease